MSGFGRWLALRNNIFLPSVLTLATLVKRKGLTARKTILRKVRDVILQSMGMWKGAHTVPSRSLNPEVAFTISCMVAVGRTRRLSCARGSIDISAPNVRRGIRVIHVNVSIRVHVLPVVSTVSVVVNECRPSAALCNSPISACGRRDGVPGQWRSDFFLLRRHVPVSELSGIKGHRFRALGRRRTRIAALTDNPRTQATTSPTIDNTIARAECLTVVDNA